MSSLAFRFPADDLKHLRFRNRRPHIVANAEQHSARATTFLDDQGTALIFYALQQFTEVSSCMKRGDFELACELWRDAVGNSRHGFEAYEQLAIYYERNARNPEQARQVVQHALDELRRAIQVGNIAPGPYREIKARFDHRMERLERKSKRPLLDDLKTPVQA